MAELAEWDSFYVIVGSSALLLLFVGIHNAWDAVADHVLGHHPRTTRFERG